MVQNFEHNICAAISGVQGLLEARKFSMHRVGIKVKQHTNGHLNIEMSDNNQSALNDL